MTVYGLGRRSTPEPFVAACDRFIYLDLLSQESQEAAQRPSAGRLADSASAESQANPVHSDHQHVQGGRLVASRRGRVLPRQESCGVRSARLRAHETWRAGPQGVLRRCEGRAGSDRVEPPAGAAQAHGSQEDTQPLTAKRPFGRPRMSTIVRCDRTSDGTRRRRRRSRSRCRSPAGSSRRRGRGRPRPVPRPPCSASCRCDTAGPDACARRGSGDRRQPRRAVRRPAPSSSRPRS